MSTDTPHCSEVAYLRPLLTSLSAYHVPDATGLIKLDAMENPYALPDHVLQHIGEVAQTVAINRYPDPAARELKATLVNCGLMPQHSPLILGNGSDELIQLIHQIIPEKSTVMALDPSFVIYKMNALICGHRFVSVEANDDFSLPLERLLDAIDREKPSVLWISYPNNPTGTLYSQPALQQIIAANAGITVIDEAYQPFAKRGTATMLPMLEQSPRLIIMRTLSKMGLAGLRLGYMTGSPLLIEAAEKIRLPYNIDSLSGAVANLLLGEYHSVLAKQAQRICDERDLQKTYFETTFQDHLQVFPSEANFLLIRLLHQKSSDLFNALLARKILVKNLESASVASPLLTNCLRITIGTAIENKQVQEGMKAFFEGCY